MFENESEEYTKNNWDKNVTELKSDKTYQYVKGIPHFYSTALTQAHQKGAELGYSKATEWHYIKDQLPPEPAEENGSLKPLEYICAYKLNNQYDDFEIGEFLYLGNREFVGENKNYPIYAWMDSPIIIPVPPEEE
jgi:hypothetical protein